MKIIRQLKTSMGCEYPSCRNEADYEVVNDNGKHHVYCNDCAFKLKFAEEPFFDGKAFFKEKPKPKLNFGEKILYIPIIAIVVIIKWIIKLQDRRKRKV